MMTLDDLLSAAQFHLRDGHHDHFSRAIADARNQLKVARPSGREDVRALVEQLRALPVTANTCPDGRHEVHFCRSQANVSRLQVLFIADQLDALLIQETPAASLDHRAWIDKEPKVAALLAVAAHVSGVVEKSHPVLAERLWTAIQALTLPDAAAETPPAEPEWK